MRLTSPRQPGGKGAQGVNTRSLLSTFMLLLHQGAQGQPVARVQGCLFLQEVQSGPWVENRVERAERKCAGRFAYTVQWQQFEQVFGAGQLGSVFVVGICVKFYDRCLWYDEKVAIITCE